MFDTQTPGPSRVGSASRVRSYLEQHELLDGLMIFDTDPLQLYKNMFTDPAYANYTQLLLLGHHVEDNKPQYFLVLTNQLQKVLKK